MSDTSNFVIEDGVLEKYNGPSGDVIIPDGVTAIGRESFAYRTDVTSIALPESVKEIKNSAFKGSGLTKFTFPTGLEYIGIQILSFCNSLTSVVLPEGMSEVPYETCYGCRNLSELTLPVDLQIIKTGAFEGCESLESIAMPDSVTEIEDRAFSGCASLTSIMLPKSLRSLGTDAFNHCERLSEVTLPESLEHIGNGAFTGCDLKRVIVPESLQNRPEDFEIDNSVLNHYHGLGGEVIIPDSVKRINTWAFRGCTTVTGVTLPDSIEYIGEEAFLDTKISANQLVLPESLTEIYNPGFKMTTLLKLTLDDANALNGRRFRKVSILLTLRTGPRLVICGSGFGSCNLDGFSDSGFSWQKYDNNIINNGPEFKMTAPYRFRAMLYRMLDPEGMTENTREGYIELLTQNVKKLILVAEEDSEPEFVKLLIDVGAVNSKNLKAVKKLLSESKNLEIAAMAKEL